VIPPDKKQMMLQYAQLVFREAHAGLSPEDAATKQDLFDNISMTHEKIMDCVKRNLFDEEEC
jgi:hypothetical protein